MPPGGLHISCSTVSPFTSRDIAALHTDRKVRFVGAPVFARPDGVERKQAYFVVGGTDVRAIEAATPVLLATGSQVFPFSNTDAGRWMGGRVGWKGKERRRKDGRTYHLARDANAVGAGAEDEDVGAILLEGRAVGDGLKEHGVAQGLAALQESPLFASLGCVGG